MTRQAIVRHSRCADCQATLQEGLAGPRCPWARGDTPRCGWPKGAETRDQFRPPIDYFGPTKAWR